jgi:hypothetical protein
VTVDLIIETLDLPVAVFRAVWYPLAAVVPMALWEPIDTVDSDSEEWETETSTVAFFRGFSAEIIAKTARVWTSSQHELSTHIQLAILKDLSPTLLTGDCPQLVVTSKFLRFFQKGVYVPDNLNAFFDKVFQPKAPVVEKEPEEVTKEQPDKRLGPEGQPEEQSEDTPTPGSTQTTEDTPSPVEQTNLKSSEMDLDTDALKDIDAVIQSQINAALQSIEVTSRPITFGSEYPETGGRGAGVKSMTDIMDHHETHSEKVAEVLDDIGDALLKHPYCTEEASAVSSMCAGAAAKWAILRLEQENVAVMEAIWRLQQIIDNNETVLAEIRSRIAVQLEKRKFWDNLNARMLGTYSDIHSETDVLNKMEGTELEQEEHHEAGQGTGRSWRERVRDVQQGKTVIKRAGNSKQEEDGAGPISRKSWQERVRDAQQGKIGMKWTSKREEGRSSSQTPLPARSLPGANQAMSVTTESQQKDGSGVGADVLGAPSVSAPTFSAAAVDEDKGDIEG